ncbi:MAG: amino acid adenylation domain-containing protein, partial [bacterium]|nr:amino acid adenylation domain-containing protein [bacterium]
ESGQLEFFSRQHKLSLASFWYGAWGILLQKYNHSEEVLFGTTVSGRPPVIKGIEHAVGLFINTIPLRVGGTTTDTILQLLRDVDNHLQIREEYRDTPLADIRTYSGTGTGETLFDSIVVIENYPLDGAMNQTGTLSPGSYEILEQTHYPMTLEVTQLEDIEVTFGYPVEMFTPDTVQRLARHFKHMVRLILKNPGATIEDVDLLTEEERDRVLYDFNNTVADYPRERNVHCQFLGRVDRTPGGTALLFGGRRLTYEQLNRRAAGLAVLLREKGIGANCIVGVMMERSVEMMTALFGILKAGGAYLPLDVDSPVKRTRHILRDSNIDILLTGRRLQGELEDLVEIIEIDPAKEITSEDSDSGTFRMNGPGDVAYVIYTSGSTGKPKGVMTEHGSLVNRLHWMQKRYPLYEGDTLLQKTPYVFDVSVWEIFWWSLHGAGLGLLGPGEEKSPAAVVEAIERYNVTVMHFVPSMLSVFLEHVERVGDTKRLRGLRRVFASGEVLPLAAVNRFNRLLHRENQTRLTNLYGPTEATIDVSYFDCSTGDELDIIPIGKPIDNTELLIIMNNRLQPVGVAGELHISGDGLGRGYLNRPELSSEKFLGVQNPFFKKGSGRRRPPGRGSLLYKTGDLARWLGDGNVEFLGRMDGQVKIRGFRIELGEIEAVLDGYGAVESCVVVVKEMSGDISLIIAYVVLEGDFVEGELKEYLRERLPGYMVPHRIVSLDRMPLTGNGKLDRRVLPEPVESGGLPAAPSNRMEREIAGTWAKVLGRDSIGVHDNFFDLGGNSLSLVRLNGQLEKVLKRSIPFTTLFR